MRLLAFSVGVAALVLLASGGHLLFIPLLILPFGLFTLPRRRRDTRRKGL
jgi:hypothetical protein